VSLRGYNAARDGKPRHCGLKSPKHRDMWYDGYGCLIDPNQPQPSTTETISAEVAKLKKLLG